MTRCSFIFPDGRPCRCPARRDRSLCRHHTAQALEHRARRAHPSPDPFPDPEAPIPRSEYAAHWRGYHAVIRQSDESDFNEILSSLMGGLEAGLLSPRSAGRLLATLVQRRRHLHQQRLNEKFIRLGQQYRAAARQAGTSAMGLHKLLAPQVHEILGLQPAKVNL